MSGAAASDAAEPALREALAALLPEAKAEAIEPLGRGHIHRTYAVRCRDPRGESRYVLQRINTSVFPDPERLAANLERVTEHVSRVHRARGVSDPERRSLRLVASPGGRTLHRADDGSWWRAFPFVAGAHAIDRLRSPAQGVEAARAFGGFLADLDDLAPDALAETIPGFHDLARRLADLERAASADATGRTASVAAELDAARRAAEHLRQCGGAASEDALPRRLVHNDCKLNNLLIDDRTGEVLCVVDLDTVMPGLALFDFGDLVRSGACPIAEDEPDLSQAHIDRDLFRALATGFVEGARGRLAPAEIASLALAGPRIALELAVRFLTDHLEGDGYFPVAQPGQNRDRARVQLRIVEALLAEEAEARALFDALAR